MFFKQRGTLSRDARAETARRSIRSEGFCLAWQRFCALEFQKRRSRRKFDDGKTATLVDALRPSELSSWRMHLGSTRP